MKDSIYVIVTRRGVDRTCKTGNFDLKPGERAFKLEVGVPDDAFAPPVLPTVRLTIPREALVIEATVESSVETTEPPG